MSLTGALFSGVSGLDTLSTAISVSGDNIANVNTTAFKSRRAEFADIVAQSLTTAGGSAQLGGGSAIANVRQLFTSGTIQSTGRPEDVAIEGRGFFMLSNNGVQSFTRDGAFKLDENGILVSNSTARVQGFGIDPLTQASNGVLGDIAINTGLAPPRVTANATVYMNLNSDVSIEPVTGPFDPANHIATSNLQSQINIFDSLGGQHSANIFYTRLNNTDWAYNITIPASDTPIAPVAPGAPVVMGSGTLQFDATGALVAGSPASATFTFNGAAAPGQVVSFDFGTVGTASGSTGFARESAPITINQDGFAPGNFVSLEFAEDGTLLGKYDNGQSIPLAQLALADFPSVESLTALGNNEYSEAASSGQPLIGAPLSGQFGGIAAGSLEGSNVDLAGEFVRLIINQRAFQANTRTISTTSELLGLLVTLGQ